MPGSVNQIQTYPLSVHPNRLHFNRYPLSFQLHAVQHLFFHFSFSTVLVISSIPVRQSALPVVNVSDNGKFLMFFASIQLVPQA